MQLGGLRPIVKRTVEPPRKRALPLLQQAASGGENPPDVRLQMPQRAEWSKTQAQLGRGKERQKVDFHPRANQKLHKVDFHPQKPKVDFHPRAKISYPEKEVEQFWALCRAPPTLDIMDPEDVIQRRLGGGKADDNKILVARVNKAQGLLDVCVMCDGEEAEDTKLARKALDSAKKELAKATKVTPLNMHALNSAKESYLAQQVSASERRLAGKEKAAKRAEDAIAALQAHLKEVTGEILAIQEKQTASEAA